MTAAAQLKQLTQHDLDELFKSVENLKVIWPKPTTLDMCHRLLEDEQERREYEELDS